LKAKKKYSLASEVKSLVMKEWRPLRDTRVEEDVRDKYMKEQKKVDGTFYMSMTIYSRWP